MKLMEIPTAELTLEKVIQICRQVELTAVHLKSLQETTPVNRVNVQNHGKASNRTINCDYCCKSRDKGRCPAYHRSCNVCHKKGHYAKSKKCHGAPQQQQSRHRDHNEHGQRRDQRGKKSGHQNHNRKKNSQHVHYVEDENEMCELFEQCSTKDVFKTTIDGEYHEEWTVDFNIGGELLTVEIDSGARCNILGMKEANKLKNKYEMKESKTVIKGISGEPLKAVGRIVLHCNYNGSTSQIEFQVLNMEHNVNLLGRNDSIRLGLIARVHMAQVNELIDEFKDVVGDEIGCLPEEYEIKIDMSTSPVIHAPRPVPAAIRDQVKKELDHLQRCNIIAPVQKPTEWVNSMVCVRKKNGRVRICIDPTDLNKAIQREHYPMNELDDTVTRVHGSKYFSTLDANMGYYQVKLTDESSYATTFNTPFGHYRYLRLPMGLKSSSEVFQREMVMHFGDIEGVEIVVDDILVHGKTLEEHNSRLRKR